MQTLSHSGCSQCHYYTSHYPKTAGKNELGNLHTTLKLCLHFELCQQPWLLHSLLNGQLPSSVRTLRDKKEWEPDPFPLCCGCAPSWSLLAVCLRCVRWSAEEVGICREAPHSEVAFCCSVWQAHCLYNTNTKLMLLGNSTHERSGKVPCMPNETSAKCTNCGCKTLF